MLFALVLFLFLFSTCCRFNSANFHKLQIRWIYLNEKRQKDQSKNYVLSPRKDALERKMSQFHCYFLLPVGACALKPKVLAKNNIRISLKISCDSMAAERIVYCVSVSYLLRVSVNVYLFLSFSLPIYNFSYANCLKFFIVECILQNFYLLTQSSLNGEYFSCDKRVHGPKQATL